MDKDEKNKGPEVEESEPSEGVSEYDETVLQTEGELKGGPPPEEGPYMIVAQGPRQGLKFPLAAGDNTIGRTMGSEILLEDQSVSRQHAIITQTREGWTVEDNKSKNGTFVNGQRISEKVTIGHGDIIQVGIYTLRLITRPVARGEDAAAVPPDWEGKTVMMGKKTEEETATMVGKPEEVEGAEGAGAEDEVAEEKGPAIPEEVLEEKRKRPIWWNIVMAAVVILVVGGIGAYVYFKYFYEPPRPLEKVKPPVPKEEKMPAEGGAPAGPAVPKEPEPARPELPATMPIFLDFASSPLPARVSFQGQDYGMTPVKIQVKLDVDKKYSAEAVFDLKDVGEAYKGEVDFTVSRDESLVPILFKGPIGVLKVMELPKDVELYLEGYFVYDPFNAKTAKLEGMIFGKPVYIPYGKYVVELRKGKELAGSGEFIKDIRYRREILVTEDNPVFVLKVTEEDLNEFPVEVISIPAGADVFIDAKNVGKTPYKGIFPLGEHAFSLRKDGYFEHKQDLKMDKNIPVKMEIELKTTVAGEFINVGKHLMQKGQYKEAISKLTEVFKSGPTDGEVAQARYLIGSCFVHMGDLSTAEDYFKQTIENEEMKHPSMLGLVSVYHGLGRREEAIPHLIEVLLNAKDEEVKKEAYALFQQVSPLRSIMYIHTDPEGASVYLNDKLIEEQTPVILPDLSLGNYKVRIEKDGYIPQDLSINLSVNEFNPVVVKLKKIPE